MNKIKEEQIICSSCQKVWIPKRSNDLLKMCYNCGTEWMKQQNDTVSGIPMEQIGWESNL